MRTIAIMMVLALTGCTTAAPDVEPVPGSITYGGQPRTKLTCLLYTSPSPRD